MSFKGSRNPADLDCWRTCEACFRCANKGKYSKCNTCSGRIDPALKRDPYYVDDACRCTEGILQYRLQNGMMMRKKYPHSPFEGSLQEETITEDERDWNAYMADQRERFDNPDWDPIQINGKSASEWDQQHRGGV